LVEAAAPDEADARAKAGELPTRLHQWHDERSRFRRI
jgi:hypothetical protein